MSVVLTVVLRVKRMTGSVDLVINKANNSSGKELPAHKEYEPLVQVCSSTVVVM